MIHARVQALELDLTILSALRGGTPKSVPPAEGTHEGSRGHTVFDLVSEIINDSRCFQDQGVCLQLCRHVPWTVTPV